MVSDKLVRIIDHTIVSVTKGIGIAARGGRGRVALCWTGNGL